MADPIQSLNTFVQSAFCQEALSPLSATAQIAVEIAGSNPAWLRRTGDKISVEREGTKADFTFRLSSQTLEELLQIPPQDVGEFGLSLLKRLIEPSPERRLEVQVHIGLLDLMAKGYFSVLLKGGKPVAKFLASHKAFGQLRKKK
ncbi:hypothetical protein K2X33_14370 [bacterium]|nr:hypothetical protein [bacterium]